MYLASIEHTYTATRVTVRILHQEHVDEVCITQQNTQNQIYISPFPVTLKISVQFLNDISEDNSRISRLGAHGESSGPYDSHLAKISSHK